LEVGVALDLLPNAAAGDLVSLLLEAGQPLGVSEVTVYLVDFQGVVLQPILLGPNPLDAIVPEEDVASSMAGRAFTSAQPVVSQNHDRTRVWVPLVERGERSGVLALTVGEIDDDLLAECVRLGRFAGLLVRAFARTTDLLHLRRRGRTMTLAAGMQWDLLPPLTVRSREAMVSGRLEPAYEIAGDAFDYALNNRQLDAALFDGMGHGVESTLMTTLAIGGYRHARRDGADLEDIHVAIDNAVAAQYDGEAFVTAVLVRLRLDEGVMEWTNAGHLLPLLLRGQKVARELRCDPSLPLGLGGGKCSAVATERLEPGDAVLFFTDGVIECRSSLGEDFGTERLVDAWEREWLSGHPPDEILRRLVQTISQFSGGKLRDDATLLQLCWFGPGGQPPIT
jgi:hypothetical protein